MDLREKIVQAVYRRAMGKSEAARTFWVSLSSVKRYVSMAREGKPLTPKIRPGLRPKLDDRARRLLARDVAERPFLTHSKKCEYLKVVAGLSVSNSTMCRELKRMENTRKKGA
ncbi:MAG: hypothetical protein ACR2KW_01040 [Rubrobacter sp.]